MTLKKIKIFFIKAALLLSVAFTYSQSNALKKLELQIKNQDFEQAKIINEKINTKKFNAFELAQYNYLLAIINVQENKDDLAFNHYIESKKLFKSIDSVDKVAKINIEIVSLLLAINRNKVDYKKFLKEYNDYAEEKKDPKILTEFYIQIGKSFYDTIPKMALEYFKKAEKENLKTNDEIAHVRILQNIGATFSHDRINKIDSALYFYQKALKILRKNQKNSNQQKITGFFFNIYTNTGLAYSKKKDFEKALYYFNKADSIPLKDYLNKNKEILYGYLSDLYKEKGDYIKCIEYIEKQKVLTNTLNENEQKIAITEIDTKYKTEETKLQNLTLKNKLQTNKIILFIGLALLLIITTIGVLAYKNVSKKKTIAEQEKLIQTQKLETSLKEQELHEIDIMLESQEKERQRIANELHDNLGSLLATLKFNFQNLKRQKEVLEDKENQLFEKTDSLIDEAYQEVRNISHLKNLGVIGSHGLEIAVKKMAEKMSILKKLTINVIPFGLNERLENQKEITIFRMIQELCTNIIKHSHATEVNIYLTQHNKTDINIIIEDNGRGFDIKTIVSKDGIGLKSIEKKVEQMGGTFTIDSVINKGTTIIIDLPI
ncbi:sensor histidine kinase [Flavobacterium sp.]|uniref:tetratricopeptide repeat-containing sensor histidine kinase n=1 Tax=Flavobacterium sp. TaxID=239 RepID=UPI0026084F86|nr:sensor histidine kinase [Flavobacterium sp.]